MTASDINRLVILDGVTIAGVQSGYLVWELAGDEKFCDSKRSVTLNVVILNGFDCTSFVACEHWEQFDIKSQLYVAARMPDKGIFCFININIILCTESLNKLK